MADDLPAILARPKRQSPLERILMGDEDRMAYGTGSSAEMADQPAGLAQLIIGLYNSLGETAKKAIGNSQTAIGTGYYNPAPVMEAAMLPMGTGAIAGVPVKGAQTVLGSGPIRAYHGSPHDFDRFDLSKIGTGEGAQAYGHGLYFAENEAVARGYRETLSRNQEGWTNTAKRLIKERTGVDVGDDAARSFLQATSQNADDPVRAAKVAGWGAPELRGLDIAKLTEAATAIKDVKPGRMYEVNINADPAHFLDWDKPLAQQSSAIRSAVQPYINKDLENIRHSRLSGQEINDLRDSLESLSMTGRQIYQRQISLPKTTEELRDAGVPGIKYLDQGSRSAGEGSRNFVVFDDKLIDILRKYGIFGPAAVPAMQQILGVTEQKT